jgi:hypothetical protein
MKKRRAKAEGPVLRQMAERGIADAEEFDAWLAARQWSWHGLDRGDYGVDLESARILYTFEDPVRWCETFLVEPDTGEAWRFFDYQKDSVRAFTQDVVHQDGAEVGKTREIVALVLWGQCTSMGLTVRRPWMLIGAPQQTHLDEIILAVEEQVGAHEDGSAGGMLLSQFWLKPKRTPHMMQRFKTIPLDGEAPGIGRVYYRPAGHDGEAFRGVHVNAMLLMDEAAKLKRAVQWSEFWRSAKPGCCKRIYSVPDGDRSTEFFRLSQQALRDLPEGREGWRLFHWPKTVMPAPFWSPEREARLVRDFGGRHTPGYKRNVLGEWGEAENPIWSWDLILPNVQDLPDYRVMKLNVDRARREMHVEVKSIALHVEHGRKSGVEQWLEDGTISIDALMSRNDAERREAMRALLRTNLQAGSAGVYWAGADLGESNDPTEIWLSEQRGPKLHDVLRIHARGMDYYMQRELIYCLSELYGFLPHWGCDLGAAGTVVVKDLQTMEAYADAHFDERMSGFQFSNAVDCIGEDGEPLLDSAKAAAGEEVVVRAPAKHWASQAITKRLTDVGYTWAYDSEALNAMTNQTCREGAKWPIYSKKDDHIPDARRMQMLRKLYDEGEFVDVFASGAYVRAA